jgi:hypothetical protein
VARFKISLPSGVIAEPAPLSLGALTFAAGLRAIAAVAVVVAFGVA